MKRAVWVLSLVTAVLTVSPTQAQPMGPSWRGADPRHQTMADPAVLVHRGLKELLGFMKQSPRPSEMKLAAFLQERVAPNFDFSLMAKSVAGPAYRRMSGERRADLQQRIAQDFLQVLTQGLAGFDGQKVRFLPTRRGSGQRASVSVAIANPGSYPSRLDFRLYHGKDGWKVYDVVANRSSAVSYYRQKFAGMWRRAAHSQFMPRPQAPRLP